MKSAEKFLSVVLAICMLLSLVACDNKNTANIQIVDDVVDSIVQSDGDETSELTREELEQIIETLDPSINTDKLTDDKLKEVEDDLINNFVKDDASTDDKSSNDENEVTTKPSFNTAPSGEYNKGVVLVKFEDKFDATAFGTLQYISAEALYEGAKWYSVKLADQDTTEDAVSYLTELGKLEKVDYDYIMGVTADVESVDVSCNPDYDKHKHHHTHKVPDGWQYAIDNDKNPGGSSDVVIAVIDTGVDYNHLDLRNNIWVNTAEIADNGKDDDGNGYIDDVYGWDCVGNDNDPMDDNGHGTHVAGIIAAENNELGGVGIAYNCKIMVLKAGNSSGYFNNSDIAEAIQYAYMNGASVINMSFGGSNISIAVEDALQDAYNSCVLVAAAGNNNLCNQPACPIHINSAASYPAALPYVIGVMSTNANGTLMSGFSNYDHHPYNSVEYEVFAVGEAVPSTWPGNRYATLNGTSMAAPTVSGVAALLRSYYTDREVYSTKFIQSQIVNTGTKLDGAHTVVNVYDALTQTPKPAVNLYDYYIDDSTSISEVNNGNGVIDAGETVRLCISLHNRGGVASDVNVSIDTERSEGIVDPYFAFVNTNITLSDIGTYSVRESGDKYFEIVVDPNCPNDYLVNFNIQFTYKNGMDENDKTVYSGDGVAQFNVSRGFRLPSIITEDTVYTADKLYIVGEDVIIPEGVTVTFEEGCEIQFYDDREYYSSPIIIVYGTLYLNGTKDNMINVSPGNRYSTFGYGIASLGNVVINYVDATNLLVRTNSKEEINKISISNCLLRQNITRSSSNIWNIELFINGQREIVSNSFFDRCFDLMYSDISSRVELQHYYYNNYIEMFAQSSWIYAKEFAGNTVVQRVENAYCYIGDARDNIFCTFKTPTGASKSLIHVSDEFENNVVFAKSDVVTNILNIELNQALTKFNQFSNVYQQYASQVISGYYDSSGNPTIDVYGSLSDTAALWPYIVGVEIFDKDGNAITTIGKEEIKVRVTFNRPMNTTKDTFVTFGTIEPYADYRIDGEYISDTVWEGTYTLKAQIENGQNFLKVNNACAAEDQTKTVFGEYQLHEFTIDTTEAMAMNLQAVAKENGIELTFAQDDYDTLLGYNIYRSTEKDGNYVKLNPAILLPDENSFLDENAEPGKTYWYTYTVVLSDFTESNPAGKVMATALDTMSPSLYHTPVNQGYENNNLVITATATDNIAISQVTLYYRTVGATEWKSLSMSKQNDKFSATIFGSDVTLAGIEYYIVATDGINAVQKGSAETPYIVLIKSADSLLGMGDVDGNGTVTVKDALMLMQCLNGDLLLTDDAFKRADLDNNGVLSSAEALCILQYVNGNRPSLEI